MNKDIKAKWVAALRSGKYKQTRGTLKDSENGFCCLGVLSDLFDEETRRNKNLKSGWDYNAYIGMTSVLAPAVMKWAGIESPDPKTSRENSLITHNDGDINIPRKSFKQIATIIEKSERF